MFGDRYSQSGSSFRSASHTAHTSGPFNLPVLSLRLRHTKQSGSELSIPHFLKYSHGHIPPSKDFPGVGTLSWSGPSPSTLSTSAKASKRLVHFTSLLTITMLSSGTSSVSGDVFIGMVDGVWGLLGEFDDGECVGDDGDGGDGC